MDDEELSQARERVITAMEQSAAEFGLPRSCGRIYGELYFASEPLSLAELSERTGYAKSTVSEVTGTMGDIYLVRRVSPPSGGRRAYFEAERDLWFATRQAVEEGGRREIRIMRRALDEAERTLADASDDRADAFMEHVDTLQETYREFEAVLDLLERVPPGELRELLELVATEGTDALDPSGDGA